MVLSSCSFTATSISISIFPSSVRGFPVTTITSTRLKFQAFFSQSSISSTVETDSKSAAQHNSLKALGWDSLCESVASFAGTSLGREAAKTQLWSLNQTYEESLRLLDETNAAVQMHRHGGFSFDFSRIDVALVKSAIRQARRDSPMSGYEALAVVSLLEFAETLQYCLKLAIKEDVDWHGRFMPLTDLILELEVNQSLITLIHRVIDEDGSVKDSASPALKRSREQVRMLEKKLHQLMESLIRSENEQSYEVGNVGGRWCLKSGTDCQKNISGLLLSSSRRGSIIEPLVAVPLNDELQQATASVAKAEEDVLLMLTKKLQVVLEDTEQLLNSIIKLDVINARATYGLSYGGTCPDLFLVQDKDGRVAHDKEWILFLPKAHHPLLLQKHKQNLKKARKAVRDATADIGRRKMQPERSVLRGEKVIDLAALKEQVAALEESHPVPFDFFISRKTKVLIITGPNTGGKTACLKTAGLASMMAKSGLYVLASESVKIPWFDSVFADIGDEQSLAQSLSTFSAHLKQISDIRSQSTNLSLVLLDEVGAGTNPLEGAALGMSVLESFAESCLLTLASTHHGELKTLKYSNDSFENACMEFDEVNLKPTYKIMWGIPGRSNAISIAERLGLPNTIINNAREIYGSESSEINEVIIDMEKFKQESRNLVEEAQRHLKLSRDLKHNLMTAKRKIEKHSLNLQRVKMREISDSAARARGLLHSKLRQFRASPMQNPTTANNQKQQNLSVEKIKDRQVGENPSSKNPSGEAPPPEHAVKKVELPNVGSMVHVLSLGRKVTVLKVDAAKEEVVVQAGKMKLKLKLTDIGF